jgi:DNA-binding IclR family transcriptional regulator
MDEINSNTENSYIIEALYDATRVLDILMDNMIPFDGMTLKEIAQTVKEHGLEITENKIYRIMQTYIEAGWVELKGGKKYAIGGALLQLSHRYLKSLSDLHDKIRMEVNRF